MAEQDESRAVVMTTVDRALVPYGLHDLIRQNIRDNMNDFMVRAENWKAKIELIKVTHESQTKEMALAREARLALKEIRVNADKVRKKLKEDSNKYNNA